MFQFTGKLRACPTMRIRFLTSTPLDIRRGSGTYVGIAVLARALRELGTK